MSHIISEDRLNDAEQALLKGVRELEFAGLIDNNVLHHVNLNNLIKDTFAELRLVEVDAIDVSE